MPISPSGCRLPCVGCPQGLPARGCRQTGRGVTESQNASDPGSARMAVRADGTSGLPDVSGLRVGILGGTGDQGRGLAYRLARAGHPVLVGSRNAVRGEAVATDLSTMPGVAAPVTGGENRWAAEGADLVIVAVPGDGPAATLADLRGPLAGKVVVDGVNPLGFDARGPYAVSAPEGSAAEQAAALLPDSRVCAAFHHVSAVLLADPTVSRIDLDVLV